MSGFKPTRVAATSTAGRIAKRTAKISAIAHSDDGIEIQARSRNTNTNTPAMPSASERIPEWRFSQLTARLRRNAMRNASREDVRWARPLRGQADFSLRETQLRSFSVHINGTSKWRAQYQRAAA